MSENWSQLTAEATPLLVAPAQALKLGHGDVLQYVRDDVEYLAVNSISPYGSETEQLLQFLVPPTC